MATLGQQGDRGLLLVAPISSHVGVREVVPRNVFCVDGRKKIDNYREINFPLFGLSQKNFFTHLTRVVDGDHLPDCAAVDDLPDLGAGGEVPTYMSRE